MASVQMSQTLRDQITDNYKKQLYVAYRQHHNIQPAIDTILHGIVDNDPDFAKLCKIQEEYQPILDKVKKKYKLNHNSYYGSDTMTDKIVRTETEIGLVCNPNRPITQNLTLINDWFTEHHSDYDENQKNEASDNYVEGDVPVKVDNLPPYYTPCTLKVEYERGWNKKQFAPHSEGNALLVTDPELCKQLSPVGEIELKVGEDVRTFKEYISKITTLKRFIDEWPGGKDLVPEEYLQRMLAKKVPAKANRMTPDQIIPDELKEQMNEVILTNKLLGDD